MKPLSGLDASFLYLETPETPMHVASLHLYALPSGFRGSFTRRIRRHMAERLHLVPLLRQRLAFMPLDIGHPGWVSAEPVDVDWHVRAAGPARRPLSTTEVQAEVERLHGLTMDRRRPLWEFHVFERVQAPQGLALQDGERVVAVYVKIHHAALDGKAGTLLAHTILDLAATPRPVPPVDPERVRRRTVGDPGVGEKVATVLLRSAGQYLSLVRALPDAVRALGETLASRSLDKARGPGGTRLHLPLSLAPRAVFNAAITPQRRVATASLPFATCHELAHAAGGSFNDLVLWLCATALREYLGATHQRPRRSLVAAMPVSLREAGNEELNTQASMMLVALGTQHADPRRRMAAVLASTAKVKAALADYRGLLPTDYPSLLAPWVVGGVARAAFRLYRIGGVDRRLPLLANLVISNVPGPTAPLYLAGARMLTYHPLSIVTHGLGLNITLQTYAGRVDFGLVADAAVAPDLERLAQGIEQALDVALATWGPSGAMAQPPRVTQATKRSTMRSKVTDPAALPARSRDATVSNAAP